MGGQGVAVLMSLDEMHVKSRVQQKRKHGQGARGNDLSTAVCGNKESV